MAGPVSTNVQPQVPEGVIGLGGWFGVDRADVDLLAHGRADPRTSRLYDRRAAARDTKTSWSGLRFEVQVSPTPPSKQMTLAN